MVADKLTSVGGEGSGLLQINSATVRGIVPIEYTTAYCDITERINSTSISVFILFFGSIDNPVTGKSTICNGSCVFQVKSTSIGLIIFCGRIIIK